MNQDLKSLNSSIDNVYSMASQRSENKKKDLLLSLSIDKKLSSSPKRKNKENSLKKNKVSFHNILPCHIDHNEDDTGPLVPVV